MATLVLASGSQTRHRLLTAAGLAVEVERSAVDEAEVKRALRAEGASARQVAETLAELKAQQVSSRPHRQGALVIAADQMLRVGPGSKGDREIWFDKAVDLEQARAQLFALAGKAHVLETSVAVCQNGQYLWHQNSAVTLTMRPLTDAFLDDYLAHAGPAILQSVGAYHLEGLGAQLFSRVEGDYFSVLGLPLLPLLDFLRGRGELLA